MINLIEKHVFPEQSGLVELLKKYHHKDSPRMDCYLDKSSDDYDIALYYGYEPINVHDKIVICFHPLVKVGDIKGRKVYYFPHPIRDYLEKWEYHKWDGKHIEWETIVQNDLKFRDYRNKVILYSGDIKEDLRLCIHSRERHIPCVLSKNGNKYVLQAHYEELRKPNRQLSHDEFIRKLTHIAGKENVRKNKS